MRDNRDTHNLCQPDNRDTNNSRDNHFSNAFRPCHEPFSYRHPRLSSNRDTHNLDGTHLGNPIPHNFDQ